jgi:hypothetical protein
MLANRRASKKAKAPPMTRREIAYHEAGHIAAYHLLNLGCGYASIEPKRAEIGGFVDSDEGFSIWKSETPERRKDMARRHMLADYAGFAAAKLAGSQDKWYRGAKEDYIRARRYSTQFGLDAASLRREANRLMEEHFELVRLYAEALLEHGTLGQEALISLARKSGVEAIEY